MEKKRNNKHIEKRLEESMRVQKTDEMSEEEYFEYVKSQGCITLDEFRDYYMNMINEIFGKE